MSLTFDDGAFPIWKGWGVDEGADDGAFPLGPGLYSAPIPPTPSYLDKIIIWVSKLGNDVTGDGSQQNPYLTIERALQDMNNGDQIRILDGLYTPTYSIVVSGIEGSIFAERPGSVTIKPLNATIHHSAVVVLNSPRFYIFGVNIIQSDEDSGHLTGIYANNVGTFIAYTCSVAEFDSTSGSVKGIFANADQGKIENCLIENLSCAGYNLYGIDALGVDIIDCHVKNLTGTGLCTIKSIKIGS